jgi:hypothetical protein
MSIILSSCLVALVAKWKSLVKKSTKFNFKKLKKYRLEFLQLFKSKN